MQSNLPRVTKSPTGETVAVNGSAQFIAKYENADLAEWHFVSPDGSYWGGRIAPEMRMRFQALSQFTAKLPLVEPKPIHCMVGDTTESSILTGVIHGMANEIDGMIEQYSGWYPSLKVLFSGGDSPLLLNFIKKRIFAAQNPVLFGLLKILKLNASEE